MILLYPPSVSMVASELKYDLWCIAGFDRRLFFVINAGKSWLNSFDNSSDSGSVYVKMNVSAFEEIIWNYL